MVDQRTRCVFVCKVGREKDTECFGNLHQMQQSEPTLFIFFKGGRIRQEFWF